MAPNNPPVLLAQLALLALGCAAAGDSSWRDLTWWQLQALSTGEKLPVSALQGPPAASHLQDHLPSHLQAHLQAHLQPQDHRKLKDHLKGTYNIIVANGYPAEEQTVHTEDGYILNMYRIPNPGRTVVYLQHGLLSSSADWVFLGKGRALAFLLHDAGYDVWMGNNRGTTPSRRHEQLKPSDAKFWDFSWHEIGVHDLPAEIDHVLAATNHSQLHFVGHSQGTTTFFVLGSERPEYMTKVKTFTALAPIAYLRDVRSIPVRLMAIAPNTLNFVLKMIGVNEFLPSSELISWLGDLVCTEGHVTQGLCDNILFIIVGADQAQINQTIIPDFLANTPAGASTKQLLHYGQLVKTKDLEFKKFDYGLVSNLLKYRSIKPPSYDLSRVTALTYMMYSDNDLLSVHSNVIQLSQKLPNIAEGGVRKVPFEKWNHLDYLLGTNAKEFVYDEVIDIIQAYEHRS